MEHFFQSINGWFSFPRLYSDVVSKMSDGSKFVEVGCFTGKSFFYFVVEAINNNKKFEVSVVDSFSFNDYPPNEDKNILDVFKENAEKVDYPINIIVGNSSQSAEYFEDGSVDFCFLDADHVRANFEKDVRSWLPKIKKGGVLAGHDYCDEHPDVAIVVNEIFGNTWSMDYLDEKCWLKRI